MKFSVALVCLAVRATALQHSLVERDLPTVTAVLDDVKFNLKNLSAAVESSTDDPGPLLLASNGLIKSLKAGKAKVDGTSGLSFLDAIALIRPVQDITNLGSSLTSNLKGIKAKIERLNECAVVRLQVASISSGSQAMIQSVNSKIPESAREIANELTARLSKVLEQSQDDFSDANCQNGRNSTADPNNSTSAGAAGPATFAASSLLALAAVAFMV